MQNLFIHFWENAERINLTVSIKAYLFESVRNRCINHLRDLNIHDKHNLLYLETQLNYENYSDTPDPEIILKINAAISQLPKQMSEIFRLKYLEGKKLKEIATLSQVSENTIKTQLQRAKDKIRRILGKDELYSELRGPGKNMTILATAYADTLMNGTGRNEPILMTITYGIGRIFQTVLGNADENGGPSMQCVGFITTFQRGAEWAASGAVTQEVPFDFPTAVTVSLRPNFSVMTIEDDLAKIAQYDLTKSTKYFVNLQHHMRKEAKTASGFKKFEKMMLVVLEDKAATVEGKKLLLGELSWMGSSESIPVIQKLTENSELKAAAEAALERINTAK